MPFASHFENAEIKSFDSSSNNSPELPIKSPSQHVYIPPVEERESPEGASLPDNDCMSVSISSQLSNSHNMKKSNSTDLLKQTDSIEFMTKSLPVFPSDFDDFQSLEKLDMSIKSLEQQINAAGDIDDDSFYEARDTTSKRSSRISAKEVLSSSCEDLSASSYVTPNMNFVDQQDDLVALEQTVVGADVVTSEPIVSSADECTDYELAQETEEDVWECGEIEVANSSHVNEVGKSMPEVKRFDINDKIVPILQVSDVIIPESVKLQQTPGSTISTTREQTPEPLQTYEPPERYHEIHARTLYHPLYTTGVHETKEIDWTHSISLPIALDYDVAGVTNPPTTLEMIEKPRLLIKALEKAVELPIANERRCFAGRHIDLTSLESVTVFSPPPVHEILEFTETVEGSDVAEPDEPDEDYLYHAEVIELLTKLVEAWSLVAHRATKKYVSIVEKRHDPKEVRTQPKLESITEIHELPEVPYETGKRLHGVCGPKLSVEPRVRFDSCAQFQVDTFNCGELWQEGEICDDYVELHSAEKRQLYHRATELPKHQMVRYDHTQVFKVEVYIRGNASEREQLAMQSEPSFLTVKYANILETLTEIPRHITVQYFEVDKVTNIECDKVLASRVYHKPVKNWIYKHQVKAYDAKDLPPSKKLERKSSDVSTKTEQAPRIPEAIFDDGKKQSRSEAIKEKVTIESQKLFGPVAEPQIAVAKPKEQTLFMKSKLSRTISDENKQSSYHRFAQPAQQKEEQAQIDKDQEREQRRKAKLEAAEKEVQEHAKRREMERQKQAEERRKQHEEREAQKAALRADAQRKLKEKFEKQQKYAATELPVIQKPAGPKQVDLAAQRKEEHAKKRREREEKKKEQMALLDKQLEEQSIQKELERQRAAEERRKQDQEREAVKAAERLAAQKKMKEKFEANERQAREQKEAWESQQKAKQEAARQRAAEDKARQEAAKQRAEEEKAKQAELIRQKAQQADKKVAEYIQQTNKLQSASRLASSAPDLRLEKRGSSGRLMRLNESNTSLDQISDVSDDDSSCTDQSVASDTPYDSDSSAGGSTNRRSSMYR